MNTELISFKNSIIVDLKTNEAIKNRAVSTIQRFKTIENRTVADQVTLTKAEEQEIRIEEKIELLNNSLKKLNLRDYSEFEQFKTEMKKLSVETRKQEQIISSQRAIKDKKKQKKKDATYKKARQERRSNNWDKKKHGIYYRKYLKADDTLPDYMRDNLRTMPNNKGYIWRSAWFLGEKNPIKDEPTILFEKRRGVLKIHKHYKDRTEIFKKINGVTSLSEKKLKKRIIEIVTPPGAKEIKYDAVERRNNRGNNRGNNNRGNNNRGNNNRGNNNKSNNRGNNNKSKSRNLSSWN